MTCAKTALFRGSNDSLALAEAAPPNTVAVLQYESAALETATLPVQIERRLLRLTREKDGFSTAPVKDGEALRTDALYLDEITLQPAAGARAANRSNTIC